MAESILACSACLRRAIQLVPRQNAVLERRLVQQALLARPTFQARRLFASDASGSTTEPVVPRPTEAPKTLEVAEVDKVAEELEAKKRAQLRRNVTKQLKYNDDPWKIGQVVERLLKKDQYAEALMTTQEASKNHQAVVSWNHLIGYMLEQQQLKAAVKLYNDMKKRAQLPNVQTYTIMFRGMARSQHPKLAVAEAVKHYNILMRDARIKPNSTHMNAVINVCGRAGDLDSMFTILDSVNDSFRAPTAFTYTSILNALRYSTQKEIKDLDQTQQEYNLDKMVNRAKAIWEEVIDKWQKGRLIIDEELVCAMGRLLASSPKKEHQKEVLDMVEQTMNVPNFAKAGAEQDAGTGKTEVSSQAKGLYAVPGRNTLALIILVLAKNRLTTAGIKYWNVLVRERNIVPDRDNWVRLFGMLTIARASAHAAEVIDFVPDQHINYRFYHMAMTACVRDNINQNAIKHSNTVLDSMVKRLELPDLHTMRLYLRASLVNHYFLRVQAKQGEREKAKREYGTQITKALARLWDPYRKLHNHYFKEVVPANKEEEQVLYNNKREVIALARIMYSSFSKVIEEKMLPEDEVKQLKEVGGRINKEIQKFYKNREQLEPDLNSKAKATQELNEYGFQPTGDFVWDTTKTEEESPISSRRERVKERWNEEYGESRQENRRRAPGGQDDGWKTRYPSEGGDKQGRQSGRRNRYESEGGDRQRNQRDRRDRYGESGSGNRQWKQSGRRDRYESEDGGSRWTERRERPARLSRE